jgi:serine/threonine protein kinase
MKFKDITTFYDLAKKTNSLISMKTRQYICKAVVECVKWLHLKAGFSHLDIKPDNFVFKNDLTVALIDFGQLEYLKT